MPQAVDRAIALLRAFTDSDPELSLTSLAARTGLPISTTHRLARTLLGHGLLEQNRDRYRIGVGLVALATPAQQRLGVHGLIRHLHSLASDIEITASFGVPVDDELIILASAPPRQRFCPRQMPGQWQPLAQTAMGLVVLAFTRETAATAELVQVRHRGYADAPALRHDDVRAIAVPVLGPDGEPLGALGIQARRHRLSDDRVRQILPVMRHHARLIPSPVIPQNKTSP